MNSNSKTFKFLSKFDRKQISQLYDSYDGCSISDIVGRKIILEYLESLNAFAYDVWLSLPSEKRGNIYEFFDLNDRYDDYYNMDVVMEHAIIATNDAKDFDGNLVNCIVGNVRINKNGNLIVTDIAISNDGLETHKCDINFIDFDTKEILEIGKFNIYGKTFAVVLLSTPINYTSCRAQKLKENIK